MNGRPRKPILAIDTATQDAAVALRLADGAGTGTRLGWRSAFRETAPAAEALLADAGLGWDDVGGLAVPGGPGSFTGLRIGAALALALAEVRGIPLFAPPTLAAIAEACAPADAARVCATLDARRGRRYAALLAREAPGAWRVLEGPFDIEPDAVATLAGGAPVASLETAAADRPSVAAALATLAALQPASWRVPSPERLELAYVRPGAEPR